MSVIDTIGDVYKGFFGRIEAATDGWLLGLAARLVFFGTLSFYFVNSFLTKVDGFSIKDNAYYQIVPRAIEAAGGNVSRLGSFDHAVVYLGTVSELLLPVLIVIGLGGRVAALDRRGAGARGRQAAAGRWMKEGRPADAPFRSITSAQCEGGMFRRLSGLRSA